MQSLKWRQKSYSNFKMSLKKEKNLNFQDHGESSHEQYSQCF